MGYSSSTRRPRTFVQEQKILRIVSYISPESFKRFGECCVYRVTSPMESPIIFLKSFINQITFVLLYKAVEVTDSFYRNFGDNKMIYTL